MDQNRDCVTGGYALIQCGPGFYSTVAVMTRRLFDCLLAHVVVLVGRHTSALLTVLVLRL